MNKLVLFSDELENPRDWDNLGTLGLSNRFYCDQIIEDSEELTEIANDKSLIVLFVYKYEHSGISFSTAPFSCSFDSGLAGLIWVSKEKVRELFCVKRISKKLRNTVEESLRKEIETYNLFANNEGVGFRIEDEDGYVIDSCGGFFKHENWEQDVASYIDNDMLLLNDEELLELIKQTEIEY